MLGKAERSFPSVQMKQDHIHWLHADFYHFITCSGGGREQFGSEEGEYEVHYYSEGKNILFDQSESHQTGKGPVDGMTDSTD
jgi:hypothetical protein